MDPVCGPMLFLLFSNPLTFSVHCSIHKSTKWPTQIFKKKCLPSPNLGLYQQWTPQHLTQMHNWTLMNINVDFLAIEDVTLNPVTAYPFLVLSEDRKQVKRGEKLQFYRNSQHRFDIWSCILAKEGYDTGRHYWEVKDPRGHRLWARGTRLTDDGYCCCKSRHCSFACYCSQRYWFKSIITIMLGGPLSLNDKYVISLVCLMELMI